MKKFEYQTIIRRNYDLMSDKELNYEGNLGWELMFLTILEKAIYMFLKEKR